MLSIVDNKIFLEGKDITSKTELIGLAVQDFAQNAQEDLELTDDGFIHCN